MWRRVAFLIASTSLAACASATTSARPAFSDAGRNVITAAEIVAARVTDAYQAVIQLRPEFLRRRTPIPVPQFESRTSVPVYLDELPFGGIESLRVIPLDRVRLIRYISAYEADLRWGGTHPGGAILVTTVR